MLNSIVKKFKYGNHNVIIEAGKIARQSNSSILINIENTVLLVTIVCLNKEKEKKNFFPLTINYQERAYSVGKFPGGFFKREGRPSENEMIISRLIDRPLRPLFPENFLNEVQIIATVISMNPQINPDIVAIIGASAALSISGIPFNGPIGAARIGYVNNKFLLNPTQKELSESKLDLIVSSTSKAILMVESKSKLLNEDEILNAINYGHKKQQIIINNINDLTEKIGKPKWLWIKKKSNKKIKNIIKKLLTNNFIKAYSIKNKYNRSILLKNIKKEVIKKIINKNNLINKFEILNLIEKLEKKIFRKIILKTKIRIDGRKSDIIRHININTNIFPRTHGSVLFTRGETQALVITTLGTEKDAQNINELIGEKVHRFLLHYNFPPYCVGEIGLIGAPKRREIGHGRLAKRSLLNIMPKYNDFPYTIRIVAEITDSNGSSSMATVCGSSLSLMDAGVPIKSPIAGVAMGLIKKKNKFLILSDISGIEDKYGDMDFKIAGNNKGITSLQMDVKINSITKKILYKTLYKAKKARLNILKIMNKYINKPKKNISKFAPRIYIFKINPEKIKNVIGKGGSVIRSLTEKTKTSIEVEDNGIIKIASNNKKKAINAINKIKQITDDIKIGNIYNGIVTRIVEFGAFIKLDYKNEGLLHISQMNKKHIKKVSDFLKLGQKISARVLEIDKNNRIKLTIKGIFK